MKIFAQLRNDNLQDLLLMTSFRALEELFMSFKAMQR